MGAIDKIMYPAPMRVKDRIKSRVGPAYRATRLKASAHAPSHRPTVVIYGNCQASALRRILILSNGFSERYNAIQIPAVNDITHGQLRDVQAVIARAAVIISQNVRDDYRGMPLGTAQMRRFISSDAKAISLPSMYYSGLHPYLVYVHATGPLGTEAPLTGGYHDLRFIHAAGAGMADEEASKWLAEFSGDAGFIRGAAAASLNELRVRESELDVSISDVIPGLGAESFWTVNHPSNAVLSSAASNVHRIIGTTVGPCALPEILSSVVVPVHLDVRDALGYGLPTEDQRWVVNGQSFGDGEVLRAHLAFYRLNPGVLAHALSEHKGLLAAAGLRVPRR